MKRSFSLIELIITIVIMGLAFVAIPAIIQNSITTTSAINKSSGIYHGVAKMQIVKSKLWDHNNKQNFDQIGYYNALDITEGNGSINYITCNNNISSPDYGKRSGHFHGENRRKCSMGIGGTPSINFGASGSFYTLMQDIDDYNNDINYIFGSESATDSIYTLNTKVQYVNFIAPTNVNIVNVQTKPANQADITNIKEITVTVTQEPNNEKIASYKYYATNIGLFRPLIKNNPHP